MAKKVLTVAEEILSEAIEQVGTKAEKHGDTHRSFVMISEMWSTYIAHSKVLRPEEGVSPRDVAQLMAILKICRSVYVSGKDHYVDATGYTAIAAMLDDMLSMEEE